MEIATALSRKIRVIPVLVDGALMPRSSELPDDLQLLVRRNALDFSHNRFKADLGRLIATLDRVLEKADVERKQREETPTLPATTKSEAEAAFNRGWAYGKKKEYDKAISDCNEAIRLDPNYASSYRNRGNAYQKLGKNEKAQADFAKANELENIEH